MPKLGGGKSYLEEFWIAIRADMSSLSAGLAASRAQLKTYAETVGNSSTQLKKLGRNVSIVSGLLLAMSGLAIKTFAKFEQSMANTFSVLGATGDEMKKLSKFARQMGKETIFTASQSADAMYYLASAGYDTNKIMGSLRATLQLAAGTQYDLAETTRLVVSALNAFRFEADQSGRVANTFAAIISSSQATMDRLGESMKFIAPIAANLDISLEEITATLGLLYNSGLAAGTAGTSLRQSLLSLMNPVPDAVDALHKLGLTVEEVSPQFNSLTTILQNFEDAGAGMKKNADLLAEIFNRRAIASWLILLKSGTKSLTDLQDKITDTNKAQELARIQLDTMKGSLKLMQSAAQESAIAFSEGLAPAIRSVFDNLRDLFNVYNNLAPATRSITSQVIFFGSAIGLLTGGIAILLSKLPAMIAGLKTLNVLWGVSFGKVMMLAAGIGALVYGLFRLVTAREREKRQLNESIEKVELYIRKRHEEATNIRNLADEYEVLHEKEKKTGIEKQKMNEILVTLNNNYPHLIKNTKVYANAIDDVKFASFEATKEIREMMKSMKETEELKLTIKYSELTREINEISEDLKKTDFVENLRDVANFNFDQSAIHNLEQFRETFKKTFYEIDKVVDTDLAGRTTIDMVKFDNVIKKTASDILGVKRVQSDVLSISTRLKDLTIEKGKIESKNDTFANRKYMVLQDEYSVLTEVLGIYENALTMSSSLTEKSKEREQVEESINNLYKGKKSEIEPTKPPVVPTDRDGSTEVVEIEKKKADLIYEINKKVSESELELARSVSEESLRNKITFLQMEYKNTQEQLTRERNLAISEAETLGLDVSKINAKYDSMEFNNQKVLMEKIKQEKENSNDEAIQDLKDRFTREEQALEESLRYRAEMEFAEQEGHEGAIQKYMDYLATKLMMEEDFSQDYIAIKSEMFAIEEALKQQQMDSIMKYANVVNSGIAGGINMLWHQWIIGSRRAKNEMDAIWLAIRNSALRAISDIITAEITKALVNLILKIVSLGTAGIGNFGGTVAPLMPSMPPRGGGLIPQSAVGSEVKKGGMVNVHPGNIIVPSGLAKKTKKEVKDKKKSPEKIIDRKSIKSLISKSSKDSMFSNTLQKIMPVMGENIMASAEIVRRNDKEYKGKLMNMSNISLPVSAVGSEVKRSGMINVHPGNIIVPANVVRKNEKDYKKASGETNKEQLGGTNEIVISVPLTLNNPIVDDKLYWEKVVEDHVVPAVEKIKERQS